MAEGQKKDRSGLLAALAIAAAALSALIAVPLVASLINVPHYNSGARRAVMLFCLPDLCCAPSAFVLAVVAMVQGKRAGKNRVPAGAIAILLVLAVLVVLAMVALRILHSSGGFPGAR